MGAHNALMGNLIGRVGIVSGCPLCYAIEHCPCDKADCPYPTWIDRAADDQLEEARRLGLVSTA